MFIDTHSHLYSEDFDSDIKDVIERAQNANIGKIVLPDIDSECRNKMLSLSDKYPEFLYPLIGLHPTSVKENFKQEIKEIELLLEKRKFWGIGETGIDLYWDKTFKTQQIESFSFHIELSLKYNLPLIVHARESLNEIFSVLDNYNSKKLKGIFHCFSGNEEEAHRAIDNGFLLGIGGVLTFKNSSLKDVINKIKLENIVLETDSPYLAPVPFRGKRNESSYLVKVAEKVAEIHNISLEKVESATTENAIKIFGF